MPPLPVLTPDQARAWDAAAGAAGMAPAALMEVAGRAAAMVVASRYAAACRQGVLVAAGPGNNGGDGWVLARALHAAGLPCWVTPVGAEPTGLNAAAAARARADGVRELHPDGPWPAPGLVIDALLGTGARGAPRPPVRACLGRLADLERPVVAIDGPTGLDLGDGVSHDPISAALTITFGGYRRGHLLSRDECGDLVVVDIGLPRPDPGWPTLVTTDTVTAMLPPLSAAAHKGTRGRVVVVGGDAGMSGAARLAARAALAAGAGLVHLIAPPDTVALVAAADPELQTLPIAFEGPLPPAAVELLGRADAVVIGPGLGRHPSRADLVLSTLAACRAAVVDADALTALQGRLDALSAVASGRAIILTPHLGEFRTLFPADAATATVDPWGAASAAAAAARSTVLLKGVPTVVAEPGRPVLTVAAGNPGLATGGSGDCLAGIAGAMLGQGHAAAAAAVIGAQALGEAADLAARGGAFRAVRPAEVIAALPGLWRQWERRRETRPAPLPPILHDLPLPRQP